jgi:CheY-like chemotaxis protein
MPHLLLVEDNELNRDMLSRRLERKGHRVSVAVDGLQGVALAQSARPDLILMDLSLPGIDGWEATRRIKADAATRAIPVIALTAHAMSGDRERALDAGCDDFDTKPVDLPRLLAKIEARLPGGGAGAAPPADAVPLRVERRLQARLERLPLVHELVDEFTRRAGLAPALAHDLRLVVEEACVNVMRYAYAGGPPGELGLALELDTAARPAALRISVCDQGQRFDPLSVPVPDTTAPAEQRAVGGLGVLLMRRLTDHQEHRHDPASGNLLTLVKLLHDPPAPPGRADPTPAPSSGDRT